jgi:hypothetical protein
MWHVWDMRGIHRGYQRELMEIDYPEDPGVDGRITKTDHKNVTNLINFHYHKHFIVS